MDLPNDIKEYNHLQSLADDVKYKLVTIAIKIAEKQLPNKYQYAIIEREHPDDSTNTQAWKKVKVAIKFSKRNIITCDGGYDGNGNFNGYYELIGREYYYPEDDYGHFSTYGYFSYNEIQEYYKEHTSEEAEAIFNEYMERFEANKKKKAELEEYYALKRRFGK